MNNSLIEIQAGYDLERKKGIPKGATHESGLGDYYKVDDGETFIWLADKECWVHMNPPPMNLKPIEMQVDCTEDVESNLAWLVRNIEGWPPGTNIALVSEPGKDGNRSATFFWYAPHVPLDKGEIRQESWLDAKSTRHLRFGSNKTADQSQQNQQPQEPKMTFTTEGFALVNQSKQPLELVGRKADQDKPRMDLIPPHAEKLMAEVLTFGAKKYTPENWRKVPDLTTRYTAAAMRHINDYRSGHSVDSETGIHHLAHAMCCLAFIIENDVLLEVERHAENNPPAPASQ